MINRLSAFRRVGARLAPLALILASAACSTDQAEFGAIDSLFGETQTQTAYEAEIVGAPSEEVESLLIESLSLYRRQEDGAPSLAFLRRRAEQDEATALKVLRSSGYYGATVSSAVTEPETEDAKARAVVTIEPGEQFTVASHAFALDRSDPVAESADLGAHAAKTGAPAIAADILAAEAAATAELKKSGFVWARAVGRRATADLQERTLSVETVVVLGPRARFGPLQITGGDGVDRAYIRSYAPFSEGEQADPAQLAIYQRALAGTDLFAAASVTLPEEPPAGQTEVAAPVTVRLEERPARSASFGARYDTDAGAEARIALEHRNLFGAGEQGEIAFLGGAIEQQAEINFRKPQFLRPGQDFTAALVFQHEEDEAYDETALTLQAGVERRIGDRWTVGAGGLAEVSRLEDEGDEDDVTLLGAPGFVRYDGSNDLLDPTEGARFSLMATPFWSVVGDSNAPFMTLDGTASIYQALDSERRHVLAARFRAGAIFSRLFDDVPANRRLYSGGGGSVRGYKERYVGPLDSGGEPTGGRIATEGGLELRSRIWGPIGAVAFVDAGGVSQDLAFDLEGGLRTAAGVGLRYYSPVGPIRADIAAPLNPRPDDDRFQVYFSIGQAF